MRLLWTALSIMFAQMINYIGRTFETCIINIAVGSKTFITRNLLIRHCIEVEPVDVKVLDVLPLWRTAPPSALYVTNLWKNYILHHLLFCQMTVTIFEEPEKVAGGGAVLLLLRRLQPLLLPLQLSQVGCVHLSWWGNDNLSWCMDYDMMIWCLKMMIAKMILLKIVMI